MNCQSQFYCFWMCEVKRYLDKSLFEMISFFQSLLCLLFPLCQMCASFLCLLFSLYLLRNIFPSLFFFFMSHFSDCAPASLHHHPFYLLLPLSPAATSSLPPAPLCSLPSWRIVSMHEQAHWWDQLSISSHKSIDLIPRHRDAHTHKYTSLCSAALLCPGGLGEIRGSLCTP